MKIVTLSDYWPVAGNAISGIFAEYQAVEFASEGHSVDVIAPVPWLRPSRQRPLKEVRKGVRVWSPRILLLPGIPRFPVGLRSKCLARSIRRFAGACELVAQRNALLADNDVVHLIGLTFSGLAFPLLLQRLGHRIARRTVLTLQGVDPLLSSVLQDAEFRSLVSAVWRSVDAIALCGSPLRRHAEELGAPMERVVVIPNGNNVFPSCQGAPRPADETVTIISVANLQATKAIDVNIRALRLIRDRLSRPSVRYWIVGDGPERRELAKLVRRLDLVECVSFLGRMSHDETLKLVADATIFSLPSYVEAFGIVYLEAMAAGKPVIGCRGTGAEDMILDGTTGYLVSPHDADAVAQALETLIRDSRLRQLMGQAASARAREFSWGTNIKRYLRLFGGTTAPLRA